MDVFLPWTARTMLMCRVPGLWLLGLVCLPLLSLPAGHAAESRPADGLSWAQFLGPQRDGICRETGLNLDWQKNPPKTLWKAPLGPSFSSVSFAGERLFTTTNRGDRDFIVCLDAASGKELWAYDALPRYLDVQKAGPGPRSTPTFHDGKVYCLFPKGDLFCLTADEGKLVWTANICKLADTVLREDDFYFWGLSASPLVEGDVVIVNPGSSKGNGVLGLHKDTGKVLWHAGDETFSYSSPIVITAAGRRQVVFVTGSAVLGLDPEKGEVLWRYPFGNRFGATCATPLWADNLLFVSAAYRTGCVALEIVADGDRLTVREKWKGHDLENVFATSMVVNGHLYGCHGDNGPFFFRCLELQTGKVKWEERWPGRCQLLAAEGQLICLNENGTVRLMEANPEKYVLKAELENMLTARAWTQPVVYGKRLYLRDIKNLLCLDLRRE
jgi:outer membrane protein assembly factor BamB